MIQVYHLVNIRLHYLEQQNARLRAALQQIAGPSHLSDMQAIILQQRTIAKDALNIPR